jgi:putative nucleotidyltransferase with HDIG domain
VLDPDTELVIVTAYSDIDPQNIADRLLPPDKLLYLLKPLHPPEIRQFASALGAKWSAERQLRDIQAGLAIQVKERTAELEKTNEQLKREIAERTRAEEELKHTLGRLRKAMDGAIHAMALTVEVRDPYTSGHQRRVANLARAMATEMGLSAVQIDGIRFAGIIHDIGKISVPSEILSKPGQLSETEFNLIKIHSQVGYDILRKIEFDWPVADIVYQHHERMDGSGYPLGLSGEAILIEARTISVADVVEAMASYRPYRPMLGIDKALEEISQKKGSLYDPLVVEACLKVFEKRAFKFE